MTMLVDASGPLCVDTSVVSSRGQVTHAKLRWLVSKHRSSSFRRPIAEHTRIAFDSVHRRMTTCSESAMPLILDSCCGKAESTAQLASTFSTALVVGIDRSRQRLSAATGLPENAVVLQADCVDFWRLCVEAGIVFARHYLFYPNPYPKSEHLQRRWHAHPIFPCLLALSHCIELRSNMEYYAQEFAFAVSVYGFEAQTSEVIVTHPVSAFERKYVKRGEAIFQVQATLAKRSSSNAS